MGRQAERFFGEGLTCAMCYVQLFRTGRRRCALGITKGVGKGFARTEHVSQENTSRETFPDPVGIAALSVPISGPEPLVRFAAQLPCQPDGVRRSFAAEIPEDAMSLTRNPSRAPFPRVDKGVKMSLLMLATHL